MKTIKLIDLLNKIANEDIPKKIKYSGVIYEYDYYKGDCGYVDMSQSPYKWFEKEIDCDVPSFLNDEVEIIEEEEEKEIEKLDIDKNDISWCEGNMKTDEDMVDIFLETKDKINELIDAVNELRKEK